MRCQPIGPADASIFIVGEAPGAREDETGLPFQGASGHLLTQLLANAGLDRAQCFITNVFMDRPPENRIEEFFIAKKEAEAEWGGNGLPLPIPLRKGKYLRFSLRSEISRLADEIRAVDPSLIIALGATASWALVDNPKITAIRGTVAPCSLVPGYKVLPTYHPAAVMRMWSYYSVVLADLMKAKEESTFKEIRRVQRFISIEPTIQDIINYTKIFLNKSKKIVLDIETKFHEQITCIGFAPDPTRAIVIPFIDERQPDWNYWRTAEEEAQAWALVKEICESDIEKGGQNGLYDIQYLFKKHGIKVMNYVHDTMLKAHSQQPEMPKGLGFLGSVHTNEAAWKTYRAMVDTNKKDE